MKPEGELQRSYLKGSDTANAIFTGFGHNLRLILALLRILLYLIMTALRSAITAQPKLKMAS